MAAEQSVRLRLILAVQRVHSKLILLHTRLTSYNTDYGSKYATLRRALSDSNEEQFSPQGNVNWIA